MIKGVRQGAFVPGSQERRAGQPKGGSQVAEAADFRAQLKLRPHGKPFLKNTKLDKSYSVFILFFFNFFNPKSVYWDGFPLILIPGAFGAALV